MRVASMEHVSTVRDVRPAAPPPPRDVTVTLPRATGGVEILDRVMIEMMRGTDRDIAVHSDRIRSHAREAARSRMRMVEQIHRQAYAARKARRLGRFARFLIAIGAALAAAAATVGSVFSGGATMAGFIAGACALAGALSGGVGAGCAAASGLNAAKAARDGARADRAMGSLDGSLETMEESAAQMRAVVEYASGLEERVAAIMEREQTLAHAATGRRSW